MINRTLNVDRLSAMRQTDQRKYQTGSMQYDEVINGMMFPRVEGIIKLALMF